MDEGPEDLESSNEEIISLISSRNCHRNRRANFVFTKVQWNIDQGHSTWNAQPIFQNRNNLID